MACHSLGKFQGWSMFQVWDEDSGLEAFGGTWELRIVGWERLSGLSPASGSR